MVRSLKLLICIIAAFSVSLKSGAQPHMRISLAVSNKPVSEVLKAIEKESECTFFYNASTIDETRKVSISVKDKDVLSVVAYVFAGTNISAKIYDDNIIVLYRNEGPSKKSIQETARRESGVTISGTITDKDNQPVVGAVVFTDMNKANAAVSDINGRFSLTAKEGESLTVSALGYRETVIKAVSGMEDITVTLLDDIEMLEEVVVVGYGVQRKSDITGAIVSVNMEETIKKMPANNVESLLQGRVAGMSVTTSSGAAGSSPSIRIRGVNSIKADGGPLVVIDGFTGGSLASISPSDIKSIEVLKDASSTAIYGSQGANGVIIVTTKTPKEGTVTVTYNGYVDAGTPANMPEFMDVGEFARMANEWNRVFYGKTLYSENKITNFINGYDTFDYVGAIFNKVAVSQSHDISVTGGTKKCKYLVSANYSQDCGIVGYSKYDKWHYRAKLDINILDNLVVGTNFSGRINSSASNGFSGAYSILTLAQEFPMTILPYDTEGNLVNGTISNTSMYNPMGFIREQRDSNGKDMGFYNWLQAYISWEILPGLSFKHDEQISFSNSYSGTTSSSQSYSAMLTGKTSATYRDTDAWGWKQMTTLNYTKTFNDNHRINATVGMEQSMTNSQSIALQAQGLTSVKIGWKNLMLSEESKITSQNIYRITGLSFFARMNYALMDRYILTATIRRDGSSLLAYENRWDTFPSFSAAWNIKQEPFLKENDIISAFKLRYGYGISGNQAVSAYSAFSKYSVATGNDGVAAYSLETGNPNLRWEKTHQNNVGLDLSFLGDRITVVADYYDKLTDNAINQVILPADMGMSSGLRNAARIHNRGFEIALGVVPVNTDEFYWKVDASFSRNNACIDKLGDIDSEYMELGAGWGNSFYRFFEGESLGTIYGLKCLGVWNSEDYGNPEIPKPTSPVVRPGAYRYEDVNGDGLINTDDYQIIGNGQAKYNWGLNNSFNWKGFDCSLFFIGFHGFDIYNYPEARLTSQLSPVKVLSTRWVAGTNENSRIASFGPNRDAITSYDSIASSNFIERGGFVKLKSITFGYTFQKPAMRLFVSGKNLCTFTGYSGNDPEITISNPLRPGLDMGTYPLQREFVLGANISF